ncbi:MAG: ABC transporter permease [Miltoncostaeaceae bacterium]
MSRLVDDTLVMAGRCLRRLPRSPDLLIGFTVQPIMFVLLFVYVFGGAIATPGFQDYTDFLIPGIVAQTIAFGGFYTALGLSEDLNKGLIDRFRSLPMARPAVLAGRTISDIVTNLVGAVILVGTGLVVGFRFDTDVLSVLAGLGLLILFGFASSWIFALIGLMVSSPEAANGVGFTLIFPITFISSAFVPVDSMPAGIGWFAKHNPVTHLVDATRDLWLGVPAGDAALYSVIWSVGLVAVFAPLAVAKYRRTTAR